MTVQLSPQWVRRLVAACLLLPLVALAADAEARRQGDMQSLPVSDLLSKHADELDADVTLYFRGQSHPSAQESLGEYSSSRRTRTQRNAEEGCHWAALSALLSLQERAKREGGNAVVDIRSVYGHNELDSGSEYECEVGRRMTGAALRGRVVKLPD